MSSVKVKALTLTNNLLSENQRIKRAQNITKIIYSETRDKIEIIDIKFMIF